MTMPKITMYVRPGCSDVARARALLGQRGLEWDEVDIERNPDALARVKEWNGGRAATPTLWIGETMLVEPGAPEIDDALSNAGR